MLYYLNNNTYLTLIMSNNRKHLKKIAPLGGKATLSLYGKNHFSLLAKKSWIKRNEKTLQNNSKDNK